MSNETPYSYRLGTYQDRRYYLARRAEPTEQCPEEFSLSVYYSDPRSGSNVEIARVDTAHGYTHFDQLYRRDENRKPVDWSYWEALEVLLENWRSYARRYDRAHG